MAHPVKKLPVLILAAGASSRMGRPKQLLPWKNTTLLDHAIANARASKCSDVFVVLGANHGQIRSALTGKDFEVIVNPHWEKGLGSSIALGTEYLVDQKRDYDGVLLMLADQPLIDTAYLNSLIDLYYGGSNSIVGTRYGKGTGVPALLDKIHFDELKDLGEDTGAKAIIRRAGSRVLALDPQKKAVDIDTEAEYKTLIKQLGKNG